MNVAEWKQARQWLINSGVIPVTHPVTKPTVDLVDFARSLRDGVFLCNLLLKLKPGCVENFNSRPIAQHTFLKNISSFLVACKVNFRIATEDLFEDSDLYEVTNFGKVVHLLSVLSHTPEARDHKWEPFPKEVHHEYYQDLDQLLRDAEEEPQSNEESIYANLNELAMLRDSDVSIYDHAPTAMEEDPYADSGIYEAIVHKTKPMVKPSADIEEKKKFILQELYETEVNYVNALNLIGMNFYAAIKGYCSGEEISLLFAIPQLLKDCHEALLKGFKDSYEQGKCDIFVYFEKEKNALLQYGEYAAQLPKATEKAKQFQNARNEISRALQNCQDRSHQRFTLADLLSVPVQRILKYPLIVTELIKCAKKGGIQSEVDALTHLHTFLNDISKYINETKRDFEAVQTIDDIELSLLEYKGPSLKDCGRLRFDGEFRIKLVEEKGDLKKRWAFLFDKVLVICKRGNIIRTFGEVKYQVKYVLNVEGMNITTDSHRHTSIKKPNVMQPFKLVASEFGAAITKDYSANGKSSEHKEAWVGAIRVANNICCPMYARNGGHFFELQTAKGAVSCSLCDRLLWGIYHQGYYCKDCNRFSHGDCLNKQGDCMKTSPRAMTMSPGATSNHPPHHHHPHMQRSRSSSIPPHPLPQPPHPHQPPAPPPYGTRHKSNGELPKKGKIYIAKMRYEGNPLRARKGQYLSFEKDERLEILDQSDSDWWEAISLITGNRGKVPSSYLKLDEYENYTKKFDKPPPSNGSRLMPVQNSFSGTPRSPQLKRAVVNDNLPDHSWFVGRLSRIDAENMLKDLQDGVFLIRESDQRKGEYAVGLRWKQHPKHIKISVNPDTNRFFVSDAKEFDSVADLVHYYQEHSLGYSFPGVDTTLRCPYWDISKPGSDGHRPSVDLQQHRPSVELQHRPSVELQHRPSVELQHRPSVELQHRPVVMQKPSLPPIPPARTGGLQNMTIYCEAMYNFIAEYPEELSLEKHCRVKLLNKDTARPKWWYGEYSGRTGLFPSNYVRELPPGH